MGRHQVEKLSTEDSILDSRRSKAVAQMPCKEIIGLNQIGSQASLSTVALCCILPNISKKSPDRYPASAGAMNPLETFATYNAFCSPPFNSPQTHCNSPPTRRRKKRNCSNTNSSHNLKVGQCDVLHGKRACMGRSQSRVPRCQVITLRSNH